MQTLWQDLLYAIRMLRKQPGFCILSLLTLAVGIGMNTAIFSLAYPMLLRPLPVPYPERLLAVSSTVQRENLERRAVSYPDFLDWRDQATVFEALSVENDATFTWSPGYGAVRLEGELVSSDYFRLLGIQAQQGRVFRADEEKAGAPVAVVSYDFWKNRAGADPALVGKALTLEGWPIQVVGVLPQGFFGLDDDTEIWLPVSSLSLLGSADLLEKRGNRWLNVFGRLKPGVTPQQAKSVMDGIATRLQKDFPTTNTRYGVQLISFRDELLGETRSAVVVLFAAVGFVLLIACTNVANLMLVRTAARRKELAIRSALGATRVRMIRQLVTESVLLSLAGGAIGALVAYWCLILIARFSPVTIPRLLNPGIHAGVLLFTFLLSLITGLAVGAVTAIRINGSSGQQSLADATSRATDSRAGKNARNILAACETALAFILLIGAGLMIRSFQKMQSIPLGFHKEQILTMSLSLPAAKYAGDKEHAFRNLLLEKMRALPGVESASFSSDIPLGQNTSANNITIGETQPPRVIRIYRHRVSPDFFATLKIPIINGRAFSPDDRTGAPPVAIISKKMANRTWPGQEPIGKRIKAGLSDIKNPWITIVGVAGDIRYRDLVDNPIQNPDDPDVYFPMPQYSESDPVLLLRAVGETSMLVDFARNVVRELDPNIPIYSIQTMGEVVAGRTARVRFTSFLMTIFAVVALLLGCIGLYGVLSDMVAQQTREIGVRIALGATRKNIYEMVLRQSTLWTFGGLLIGVAGAVLLSRLITAQLYSISPTDPGVYAFIAVMMIVVTCAASSFPAMRATRVDPAIALKYE